MEEIKKELLSGNKEILWVKSQLCNRLEDQIWFTRCTIIFLLIFFIFFEILCSYGGNCLEFWIDLIVFASVGGFVVSMLIVTIIREAKIFKEKKEDPYNYNVGMIITSTDLYVKDYKNYNLCETFQVIKPDITRIKINEIDLIKIHEHRHRKKKSIFYLYIAQVDTKNFNLLGSLRIKLFNSEHLNLVEILERLIPFEEIKHKGKIFDFWSKFYRKKEYIKIYEDFGESYPTAYGF